MSRKNQTKITPMPPTSDAKKEDQEKNGGAEQTPDLNVNKEDQLSKENEGTGLEDQEKNDGTEQTPDLNVNKEDQKLTEVKHFKSKRPLLHNGKTYSIEDDVTGLFDGEELERLLKIGAIVEA